MPKEDPIALWQHLHGASVHFALALALVSAAFDLGSKFLGKKEWRTVGFWCLLVATVLSLPAVVSGFWGQLGWFKADIWQADQLLRHRNFALGASLSLLVLFVWRSLTQDFGINHHSRERRGNRSYVLYLIAMTLAAATIGYAGYLGSYVARGY